MGPTLNLGMQVMGSRIANLATVNMRNPAKARHLDVEQKHSTQAWRGWRMRRWNSIIFQTVYADDIWIG